ncbi:MAG: hypothetical protein N2688_15135 [Burkholderiaceae bacterium]|nr:hypothetical protein [Burkholderiaceae bacterium]
MQASATPALAISGHLRHQRAPAQRHLGVPAQAARYRVQQRRQAHLGDGEVGAEQAVAVPRVAERLHDRVEEMLGDLVQGRLPARYLLLQPRERVAAAARQHLRDVGGRRQAVPEGDAVQGGVFGYAAFAQVAQRPRRQPDRRKAGRLRQPDLHRPRAEQPSVQPRDRQPLDRMMARVASYR